ncbi:YbaN family protein [Neptuniibacter marinus]|uniref:YbaN family protein n=1 Tax=Neptuniibacter marinus TaxID=1806670 RepID=UPI000836BE0C|nr:YbaN family protein [Neptuniibacter marinus]
MKAKIIRSIYLIAGCLCVVLGFIGVILPLLPTTPFLLVAAFCFSRSSERLHKTLLNNRYFGKYIRDWEDGGIIPFKIKVLATTMMVLMVIYPLFFRSFHLGLKAGVVVTIVIAMIYIWSRPSELKQQE